MNPFGYAIGIALGLIQLVAIVAGLEAVFGLHWIPAAVVATFAAFTPLVGSVLGVWGAVYGWQMGLLLACLIFFGPFLLGILLGRRG